MAPHLHLGSPHDESLCRTVVENVSDGVYFCDKERRITYWSPGAQRITGYSPKETLGILCHQGPLHHIDSQGKQLCDTDCPLVKTMDSGKPQEAQVYLHHKLGHQVPVYLRTIPVIGRDGQLEGAVEVFTDNSALIAALKRVEELRAETETDRLTGIGNRKSIETRLAAYLAERRRSTSRAGLIFIDIDYFKRINDTYGHEAGDRVLRMVANTLRLNLRASDLVARWGGEEFLVLLAHTDRESLASTAEKLRLLVENSNLKIAGHTVAVTISLGATLIRRDDTMRSVMARVDRLLYESKASGRNRVTVEA